MEIGRSYYNWKIVEQHNLIMIKSNNSVKHQNLHTWKLQECKMYGRFKYRIENAQDGYGKNFHLLENYRQCKPDFNRIWQYYEFEDMIHLEFKRMF